MNPIDIPATAIDHPRTRRINFGPPEDAEETKGIEDCGNLQVLAEPPDEHNALPRLHSWWMPTAEEAVRLLQGQPIRLTVWSVGMYPVAIGVGDLPRPDPNEPGVGG